VASPTPDQVGTISRRSDPPSSGAPVVRVGALDQGLPTIGLLVIQPFRSPMSLCIRSAISTRGFGLCRAHGGFTTVRGYRPDVGGPPAAALGGVPNWTMT